MEESPSIDQKTRMSVTFPTLGIAPYRRKLGPEVKSK